MNNWCLVFLWTILTLVGKEGGSAETGGSCPAVSPAAKELQLKIDELESNLSEKQKETGKLRLRVYELKTKVQRQAEELSESTEQGTGLEETEKKCRKDLDKATYDLEKHNNVSQNHYKEAIICKEKRFQMEQDMKMMRIELGEMGSAGKPESPGGEDVVALREQVRNCEESVKTVRKRCDQESEELKRIEKTHDGMRKNLDNCRERERMCEGERDHLSFLKKGYDVVVKQLEQEKRNVKDSKEESEAKAKEAIRGASKYQFWLAGIGVVALIGITIQLYGFVKGKMAERVANLAAAKQKEKLETKRKGTTTAAKQKKKQS